MWSRNRRMELDRGQGRGVVAAGTEDDRLVAHAHQARVADGHAMDVAAELSVPALRRRASWPERLCRSRPCPTNTNRMNPGPRLPLSWPNDSKLPPTPIDHRGERAGHGKHPATN